MDWNSPYIDHKVWILDHLQDLNLDAKEAMVLLLIDYYNQIGQGIHHENIAEKLRIDLDEVEQLFLSLADKGFLDIVYESGALHFNIEGVYVHGQRGQQVVSHSLIEEFEAEFKRPLSGPEMQRILELGAHYGDRMAICALNEAAVYDKRNLNYIEKILISWEEKGLSAEDVESGIR